MLRINMVKECEKGKKIVEYIIYYLKTIKENTEINSFSNLNRKFPIFLLFCAFLVVIPLFHQTPLGLKLYSEIYHLLHEKISFRT